MKSLAILFFALGINFGSAAQFNGDSFLPSKYNDPEYVKNRGIYITLTSFSMGASINTDNEAQYNNFATRFGVHWLTKNYQKFQCFASFGSGYKANYESIETIETGLMIGKIIHGRKRGYFDLNVGFAYFSRLPGYSYYLTEEEEFRATEIHTLGIPFEAIVYTSKLPIGVGLGLAGNLNVNQPYVNLVVQLRLGNPVVREHSALNRNRSSRIHSY